MGYWTDTVRSWEEIKGLPRPGQERSSSSDLPAPPWQDLGDYADTQYKGKYAELLGQGGYSLIKNALSGAMDNIFRAMQPPEPDYSTEGDRALALMGLIPGGSAPEGALGALIGRRAKSFPLDKEAKLEAMSPAKRVEAGYETGLNGAVQMRLPMPDLKADIQPNEARWLKDVLVGGDDLLRAYPDLSEVMVGSGRMPGNASALYEAPMGSRREFIGLSRDLSEDELTPSLRHELQHAIQRREMWPSGSSPGQAQMHQEEMMERLANVLGDMGVAGPRIWAEDIMKDRFNKDELDWLVNRFMKESPELAEYVPWAKQLGANSQDAYMRELGELEARAASRMGAEVKPIDIGPKGWGAVEGHGLDPSRPIYDEYVEKALMSPLYLPYPSKKKVIDTYQIMRQK
jgi:hypothetical protein